MHNKNIKTENTIIKDTATPLKLEPDDYRHHLDGFDLSEAQQNELLQTLWSIMGTLVDIGWGVDSVQMFFPELFAKVAPYSEKLLESKDASEFAQVVDIKKGKKE